MPKATKRAKSTKTGKKRKLTSYIRFCNKTRSLIRRSYDRKKGKGAFNRLSNKKKIGHYGKECGKRWRALKGK